MKKITKAALIGIGILTGIGATIAIGKKATGSEVDDEYFEDDDDLFDDFDGDVEENTEE